MTAHGFLQVALDLPLRAGDAAFTFAAGSAAVLPRGTGVIVPFGRRLAPGIVLGEGQERPDLRPVVAVVKPAGAEEILPLIPPVTVDLATWTAAEYVASAGEALAVATPWNALWQGLVISCAAPLPDGLSEAAHAAADAIARKPVSLARAGRLVRRNPEILAELASAGVLTATIPSIRADDSGEVAREHVDPSGVSPDLAAARTDAAWLAGLLEGHGGPRVLLLTGGSRHQAYLAAALRARHAGWPCVVVFPSVDAAAAFATTAAQSGMRPVLLHGDLPDAARLSAWQAASAVRSALVVGTRSAVFAPVGDPAVVIVDEEDSSGHKEERAPRYLTAAVAARRTRDAGVLVIGTTTPTVARFADAEAGRCRLVTLPSPRPRIGIVDLRLRHAGDAPVSRPVLDALRRTVRSGGRAVVLVDRRGYAGGLHCRECGAVERCPQCGVALPYDRARRRLTCRLCGQTIPAPHICSRCGAARLHPLGAGTERLASALRRVVPRVWRVEATLGTGGVSDALGAFRERGGVLVSTVLVAPLLAGLRPDLVAVVTADRWLHRPEFRAAERALALLRQVGMAARSEALVETADPRHPVIRALQTRRLRPFYDGELVVRRDLGYPPFRALAAATVTARSSALADQAALRAARAAPANVEVLGPLPRRLPPGQGETRLLMFKAPDRAAVLPLLRDLAAGVGLPPGVRVAVDVEPWEL
jgi:primosomal protein N' (replication factor Y)